MSYTATALGWIFKVALAISLATLPVLGITVFLLQRHDEQMNKQYPVCDIVIRNGASNFMQINDTTYPLQPDGSMDLATKAFLNPWHQQIINSGHCQLVIR